MTTVDSDDDIEKLPHIQWDSTAVPGPSGCMFPGEMTPLECQIAGHPFNGEKQTIAENNTGRRLIDLHLLADELWCKSCNVPTSLRHVYNEKENRIGLASIFYITCQLCQRVYQVNTSKIEESSRFSKPTYTVDTT